MFFITDRDERDDTEVAKMIEKLGSRAELRVLAKRELENYLLDPTAVAKFLSEKRTLAGIKQDHPSVQAVRYAISTTVDSLRQEVVRLRLE